MKLALPGSPHLTYCTNIHPGETWPEVRGNLARYLPLVKRRACDDAPMGIGLRLSEAKDHALAAQWFEKAASQGLMQFLLRPPALAVVALTHPLITT